MPMPSALRVVPLLAAGALVLACALGGCGSGGDGGDEPRRSAGASPSAALTPLTADDALLSSGTFVTTSVEGRELVAGSEVEVTFAEGTMAVSAGCNTLVGGVEVADGVLRWADEPAGTLMTCEDDLAAQDEWLRGLLTEGMTATSDGRTLRLAADDVSLELRKVPDVDLQTLLGRTWTVVGTISDGTTSRLPSRVRSPRLVVGENGLTRLDTGCNTGRTRVLVERTTLSFAPPTTTRVACREPDRTIERLVLAVIDGQPEKVVFDGSILILSNPEAGLVLEVR